MEGDVKRQKREIMSNTTSKEAFGGIKTRIVNSLPFEQLAVGWHTVKIMMVIFTSDFYKGLRNPTRKPDAELPQWEDETAQLAVYFEGADRKGATRRFTRYGYVKYDDLLKSDPEEAALCEKMGDAGYAVDKKDKVRIVDQAENGATDKALAILSRFTTAAGLPEDVELSILDEVLVGKELQIEIGARMYKGKTYMDVINFASINVPAKELSRIPKPKDVLDALPVTE